MPGTEAYIQKARLLLEQHRPLEAEKQLAFVFQNDPNNHQALSILARCKYDQKDYRKGVEIIGSAIAMQPEMDYYYYLLAFGQYHLDDNLQAERTMRIAISINPYVADYFGLLGSIALDQKKFQEALELADEGLSQDPKNITCLNVRSTALNKLKRSAEAMETMYRALETDPENDYTHTSMGWNFLEKGRNREAAVHFTEALRLNPNHTNARIGLKESLKSKILPYKWILQYSFWINNKGKKARWIIPIAQYFIVRLIAGVTSLMGKTWTASGLVVIAIYILFVFTTWVINPLANFMLLFNKSGRYAVSNREKWNAILLIACILVAIAFFVLSLNTSPVENQLSPFLIAAIISLTVSIPLGNMEFPVKMKGNDSLQWYSILLVGIAVLAILLTLVNWEMAVIALVLYGLGFMVYTWWSLFTNK